MPVYVIDTLKPKNGLDFPVVEAVDVAVEGYLNLADAVTHFATDTMIAAINEALNDKANTSDIVNLQNQINELITPVTQDAEVQNARVGSDGASYTTLKERLDTENLEASASIERISDAIPSTTAIEQKTINVSGVVSDYDTRTLSPVVYVHNGDIMAVASGYEFRYANYSDEDTFSELDSTWRTSLQFSRSGYERFVFRKTNDTEITPEETIEAISSTTTIEFPVKYTLKNVLAAINDNITELENQIPVSVMIEQKTMNASGVISDNDTRTLSAVTLVHAGEKLVMDSGYQFRYAIYSDPDTFVEMDSTWRDSLTFNSDGYKRFVFCKTNNENITPDETVAAIDETSTVTIPTEYSLISDIDSLKSSVTTLQDEIDSMSDSDSMNLRINLTGRDNMMWSYSLSLFPLCQHFQRVRNCVYWGYTTSEGYSGIACYNIEDKTIKKVHLKKSDIDDHNPCAIFVRESGDIIVSYSGGHNTDNFIHTRRSTTPECIDDFEDDVKVDIGYATTYSQIFEYNGVLWIFFRYDNTSWGCITSTDGGATWSERQAILFAPVQYYCKFQKTTTDGLLRMCMYSNPDQTEKDIRMGFVNLSNGKIYNADNTTQLGTVGTSVRWENFTVIIPTPETGKQRILDVAVTAPSEISVLYSRWTTATDGVYKWYHNGESVTICNCGAALYLDKYQGGAAFVTTERIVVSRGEEGVEYIELWNLSASPTKDTVIYQETKGTIPIRNCRPIVSPDGKSLLWHRGYYNANDYQDFNSDAKIYLIDSGTLI